MEKRIFEQKFFGIITLLILLSLLFCGYGIERNEEDYKLQLTAEKGSLEQIKELIKTKEEANYILPGGFSVLYSACVGKNEPVIKYLIDLGADIHFSRNSFSILEIASSEKINWLIKQIVREKPYKLEHAYFLACRDNNPEIVLFALSSGTDINVKDKITGNTGIYQAVKSNNLKVVKMLLEKGADLRPPQQGDLPLLFEGMNGSDDLIQLLIENTEDIDEEFNIGRQSSLSALQYAFSRNKYRAILLLLKSGAKYDSSQLFYCSRSRNNLPIFQAVILEAVNGGRYRRREMLSVVEFLLENGADPNQDVYTGEYIRQKPLELAVIRKDPEICKILLYHGADRNIVIRSYNNEIPLDEYLSGLSSEDELARLFGYGISSEEVLKKELIKAILGKDKEEVRVLLQKNADRNFRETLILENDPMEFRDASAFDFAVSTGDIELVKLFFEERKYLRGSGSRVIYISMVNDDFPMFQFLLDNMEEVERNSIYILRASLPFDIKFAKEVIKRGADVNDKGAYYNGDHMITIPLNKNNIPVIKLIYQNSNEINKLEKELISAIYDGDIQKTTEKIEKLEGKNQFEINRVFLGYMTLSAMAASQGHNDIVKMLIEKGADLDNNFTSNIIIAEQTPLFWAVRNGHTETARLLLDAGATMNIETMKNPPILFAAVDSGNPEIVRFILDKGADIKDLANYGGGYNYRQNAFQHAAEKGDLEICKVFTENNIPVDYVAGQPITPLGYAVFSRNLDLVKYLTEQGADINSETRDGSILMFAVRYSTLPVVEFLVKKGADINYTRTYSGRKESILTGAWENSDSKIAEFILNHKEFKLISAEEGSGSELHWLLLNKRVSNPEPFVKKLLKKGADPNLADKEGKSPLFYAIERDDLELVKLLVKNGADMNFPVVETKNNRGIKGAHPLDFVKNYPIYKFLKDNGATETDIEPGR